MKFCEDFLLSMMRSSSIPPSAFRALRGTMYGSPPEAQMVPYGILSEADRLDGAPTARSKCGFFAICLADSFSTQEPFGMNSALPSAHAFCDWRWSRPGEPLRT